MKKKKELKKKKIVIEGPVLPFLLFDNSYRAAYVIDKLRERKKNGDIKRKNKILGFIIVVILLSFLYYYEYKPSSPSYNKEVKKISNPY